ncbi:unnamed protein product [Parascedosporium putredinis]|uniref:BZIP domain-containing protein n=1 Tax=Parascedosporium putredinis TaxID=1442378 RepID=A0A9P1MD54_9PEZI|nr:unnamed protein product [Parascedosporium putredinis]CAI7999776.1 unnamed protein product [Parascedosporium putredinis]
MSAPSQPNDGLEGLFDFSDYDNNAVFARPMGQVQAQPMPSASQPLTRPSHQYELYKQQTGIVPGALASTLAINQSSQVAGYNGVGLEYLGLSPNEEIFDFNTAPSQGSIGASEIDMEFDSATTDQFFFENTVNPSALGDQASPNGVPNSMMTPGRLWPGMHSQAANAKAQAQRQQQVQRQGSVQPKARAKSGQPTDPIVEQKITQLLNSMRAKPANGDGSQSMPMLNMPKLRKDEDDMDEDERLLASEEGKKLSSKERRQLRNKVSARAFRSRRKEYISQLESEIATKVSENGDLHVQNRALAEENKRLTDLTHMLLSSPSFSDFLDQLSTNPANLAQAATQMQAQPVQQQQQQHQQQQQERRQAPKDPNPFAQLHQQQRIGLTMIPEQSMDMSMLRLENDGSFNYQPRVFALLETPEMPASFDAGILSGKKSNFVGEQFDSEDKVQAPVIDRPVLEKSMEPAAPEMPPVDPEFESNPDFALYHAAPATEVSVETEAEDSWRVNIFGGLEPEKVLARYELLDASQEEQNAIVAMARVQRISERLESTWERISNLTEGI